LLLEEPAFKWWAKTVLKKTERLLRNLQRRRKINRYKFGIEIPNTVEQAFELDKKNGNNLWREALEKEIKALLDLDTFEFKEAGWQPPKDYTKVPLLIKFDVKMDLRRKVRIVAGGHVTDPPTTEVYSSVVARDSVRIMFLIAQLNNLELMMTDIGNAYLNAKTKEKIWMAAGLEFGTMQG
jgi:hypothetical protein